jgi:hypothetical protein
MAYTLSIYTVRPGKDKRATETVAGVLLGTGWPATSAAAPYIRTPPEGGLCQACKAS